MGFLDRAPKKCPKCQTPNPQRSGKGYICTNRKCRKLIPKPLETHKRSKVPMSLRHSIAYDESKDNWYYRDEFGTKCWIN